MNVSQIDRFVNCCGPGRTSFGQFVKAACEFSGERYSVAARLVCRLRLSKRLLMNADGSIALALPEND